MANVQKRQKTLLGYFKLYESSKSMQCLDGHTCQAQAQTSNTGVFKTRLETSDPSVLGQRAGTSGQAILADSTRNKPSAVLLANRDSALPIKPQLGVGPVSQLGANAAQRSKSACSVSQSCTAADSMQRSTASGDNNGNANQYEQQVQQPHVDWLARALHQSC